MPSNLPTTTTQGCKTFFAPPERASPDEITAQCRKIASDPIVPQLLDSFPESAVILNRHRQIIAVNDKFATLLNRSRDELIGLRPGEAINCIHSREEPAGCGTTQFCRYCGAAQAIVKSQETGMPATEECHILACRNDNILAFTFRTWATRLVVEGEEFTVFAMRDVEDENRRKTLERIFFHDLLNIAHGLKGIAEILPQLEGEQAAATTGMAGRLTQQLVEEIEFQRDLSAAERGDLEISIMDLDAKDLLDKVCDRCGHQARSEGKAIVIAPLSGEPHFRSDERLLRRVLGNLVKNAIEASLRGQVVTVSFYNHGVPTFEVHNETVMPAEIQAQMFQRSFTTKEGSSRGIGTYSVKLLTENYLNGTVTFVSTPETGTVFTVKLPQI